MLKVDPLTGTLGGAEASLSFTYQWNPKIAEIISNLNSFKANATDFTYLDGEIGMTLIIQRERNIKEMFLEGEIQATMDIAFKHDIIRKKSIIEKIIFKPSKT